jgi:anti-sigma B factor antagonist
MGPATFEGQSLDESIQLVAVSGELDMSNSTELRRRVERSLREGRDRVVIDLDGLTHMDSSGLAALIDCHQLAEAQGGRFALVITSESVRRTVEVRGLDRLFTIVPSRDHAVTAVTAAPS